MGRKFSNWIARSLREPSDYQQLSDIICNNRSFTSQTELQYGDHGLSAAFAHIEKALREGKRIALYADYDVDGTMSCVSWIWFLESIGYKNYVHYIPDRFKEGYGVNLKAVQHLVNNEGADLIITMDTGITANREASWCKEHGVVFICTDHHKVQAELMPDCTILNPKFHPDPMYQELCGCGITFVLLRKLGKVFDPPPELWVDLLAITSMATICDVVPLNGVNHKLVQQGIKALLSSRRTVLQRLLHAATISTNAFDERDVGFRLGPRINAVGRLDHADKIVSAFIGNDTGPLIKFMEICNEKRKSLQQDIVAQATAMAEQYCEDSVLFLGHKDWHQGVVGIAASKIAESFWKPTWLFCKGNNGCKGSARSIPGFDVTDAMAANAKLFSKFGGHQAAGGYAFDQSNETQLRVALNKHAAARRASNHKLWLSSIQYDCQLPLKLATPTLSDRLSPLRPFGHGFEEPVFRIDAMVEDIQFYRDKQTGEPRHTAVLIANAKGQPQKITFFNEVYKDLCPSQTASFLVTASKQVWRNRVSLRLTGMDWQ